MIWDVCNLFPRVECSIYNPTEQVHSYLIWLTLNPKNVLVNMSVVEIIYVLKKNHSFKTILVFIATGSMENVGESIVFIEHVYRCII